MNYIQLLKPVQKLLLSSLIIIISIGIVSCNKEGNEPVNKTEYATKINYDSIANAAKSMIGDYKNDLFFGEYDAEKGIQIGGVYEIERKGEWGIKFVYFKTIGEKLNKVFESKLFEGSLKDCEIRKIKLDTAGSELIYYNSNDLFAGNRIGDVYSYIADLGNQKIYYAHLFYGYEENVSLYFSQGMDKKVKEFFMQEMKKDYQDIKVVNKDNIE